MAVDPLFAVGIVEAHILDSEADRAGKLDTATDLLGLELEEMRQTIQRALRSDKCRQEADKRRQRALDTCHKLEERRHEPEGDRATIQPASTPKEGHEVATREGSLHDEVREDRDEGLALHRTEVLPLAHRQMVDGGGLVLEGTDDGLVQQRLLDVRRDLALRLLHLIGVATHPLVVDLAEDCE